MVKIKDSEEIKKKVKELVTKSHQITKSFVKEMDKLIYDKTLLELKKKRRSRA